MILAGAGLGGVSDGSCSEPRASCQPEIRTSPQCGSLRGSLLNKDAQWFARKASLSEALPAHASSALRMPASVGMKSPCVHRCRWGSQAAALHPSGRAPALASSLCCQGGHTGSNSAHSLGPWERPPAHPGPSVLPPDPLLPPCHREPLLSARACVPFPCLCLSVSLSLSISPSVCFFVSAFLSFSLSLFPSLSLFVSASPSISVSVCIFLSSPQSLCLSLSSSVFLSFYPSLLGNKAAHTMCVK